MKHEEHLKPMEAAQIELLEDAIKSRRKEIRRLKEKARARARKAKEQSQ